MAQSFSTKSLGTLSVRPGVSPKLLARKSAANFSASPPSAGIEASFPIGVTGLPDVAPAAGTSTATAKPTPLESATVTETSAGAAGQPAAPTWSNEDETSFRALLARRKASGVRRPPNGGTQLLQPGSIKPNLGTAVAVIVGLVVGREHVSRAELVAAMASATFTHPKARPTDPSWCQGYVAGAIRSGFLAVVEAAGVKVPERSIDVELDTSITQTGA